MTDDIGWIVRGETIGLRTPSREEFIERWRYFSDPLVTTMLTVPTTRPTPWGQTMPPYTREQRERMYDLIAERQWLGFDICVLEDGRCVGEAQLMKISWPNATADLAMAIFRPEDRARHYGGEAAQLLCGYAFDGLALHRIEMSFMAVNPAVAGAVERVGAAFGARKVGVLTEAVHAFGGFQDVILMELLDRDFPPIEATRFLREPGEPQGSPGS